MTNDFGILNTDNGCVLVICITAYLLKSRNPRKILGNMEYILENLGIWERNGEMK